MSGIVPHYYYIKGTKKYVSKQIYRVSLRLGIKAPGQTEILWSKNSGYLHNGEWFLMNILGPPGVFEFYVSAYGILSVLDIEPHKYWCKAKYTLTCKVDDVGWEW